MNPPTPMGVFFSLNEELRRRAALPTTPTVVNAQAEARRHAESKDWICPWCYSYLVLASTGWGTRLVCSGELDSTCTYVGKPTLKAPKMDERLYFRPEELVPRSRY